MNIYGYIAKGNLEKIRDVIVCLFVCTNKGIITFPGNSFKIGNDGGCLFIYHGDTIDAVRQILI